MSRALIEAQDRVHEAERRLADIQAQEFKVIDAARDAFHGTEASEAAVKDAMEGITDAVKDAFWRQEAAAEEELREAGHHLNRVEREHLSLGVRQVV